MWLFRSRHFRETKETKVIILTTRKKLKAQTTVAHKGHATHKKVAAN